ncbi:MAG TPA: FkbM family methyltransferase [Candidatus Dormibacteraeota bacterium]|nr:FkbM family methyltransferase [Candidatus Dormibacteraeota bacterium]
MSLRNRLGRIAITAGLGPRWARRAYRDEVNTRMLLAFTLSADSNCIDVGANEGGVLADIVRFAPFGRHIAYEPLPHLSATLSKKFPGVDVRNMALSNTDGTSSFVYVKNMPSYSGLRHRMYPGKPDIETIMVQTERLDARLPPDYVPTLIKIDVEGAEQLVIEGAAATIKRHRPTIVFEHGKGASEYYGGSPSAVFGLLCDLAGLRVFDLDGNGPYTLRQFEQTYERNDYWNFVAHR